MNTLPCMYVPTDVILLAPKKGYTQFSGTKKFSGTGIGSTNLNAAIFLFHGRNLLLQVLLWFRQFKNFLS